VVFSATGDSNSASYQITLDLLAAVGIIEMDRQREGCIKTEAECGTIGNECSNGAARYTDSCRT